MISNDWNCVLHIAAILHPLLAQGKGARTSKELLTLLFELPDPAPTLHAGYCTGKMTQSHLGTEDELRLNYFKRISFLHRVHNVIAPHHTLVLPLPFPTSPGTSRSSEMKADVGSS